MSPTLTTADAMRLPQPHDALRIAYGSGPNQFGDLRLPRGEEPHPVAIVIHGGCWEAEYDLAYMSGFCAALTEAGMATWSIEYCRVGNPGGSWPGTFLDVGAAADFMRELSRRFPLDAARVIAVGHSAGGHLALWLASRHNLSRESELFSDSPLPLRAVVSLAGIPDLAKAGREGVCGDMPYRLMGGTPEQYPERYRSGSPAENLPLRVPLLLLHGDCDTHVPISLSSEFAARARTAGDAAEFRSIAGAGHFEIVAPSTGPCVEVLRAVLSLAE